MRPMIVAQQSTDCGERGTMKGERTNVFYINYCFGSVLKYTYNKNLREDGHGRDEEGTYQPPFPVLRRLVHMKGFVYWLLIRQQYSHQY